MFLKNYLNVNIFFLIFYFIIFLVVDEENKKNVNYESNREYVHISQRNKNVTVSEDQNMCC